MVRREGGDGGHGAQSQDADELMSLPRSAALTLGQWGKKQQKGLCKRL